MKPTKQNIFLLKLFGLFAVVRGYNILILVIAQYLSSIYILAPEHTTSAILFDLKLFLLILSTSLVVASGYIINSFYDFKKDAINRPIKTSIDRLVSQKSKLYFYFILNFTASGIAFFISWRALLFFTVYIFSIWLYSHKIKKIVFLGNLFSAILTVTPFFALFLYYKNIYEIIFFHAMFLFGLVYIKEIIKDLENIKGDLANEYPTIPVVFSPSASKTIVLICSILIAIPLYFLVEIYEVGYMYIYFVSAYVILIFVNMGLYFSTNRKQYLTLYNIIKWIILLGVFSIVLIEPNVILKSRILISH